MCVGFMSFRREPKHSIVIVGALRRTKCLPLHDFFFRITVFYVSGGCVASLNRVLPFQIMCTCVYACMHVCMYAPLYVHVGCTSPGDHAAAVFSLSGLDNLTVHACPCIVPLE